MKIILFLAATLFSLSTFAQVLATVGNTKITADEFNRKLAEIRKETVNPPTPQQFLEDLIRFEVGVQEAEKQKLQNDPLVKERFRQVLYNALLEKHVGGPVDKIKITEPEMKEFYKKNPELHLAHILFEVKTGAKPEEREVVRKRAMENLEEVKKTKRPFEELAKLYSDDLATKEIGGDIGFQSRASLVPALYDVAVTMKPGEVRGLVETRFGFHILKLLEKQPFDMADKRQIRAAVFDDKRAKIFDGYFDKIKKSYSVKVEKDALKSLK